MWKETDSFKMRGAVAGHVFEIVAKMKEHPWLINCGLCEEFAGELAERLDGAQVFHGEELPEFFTEQHEPDAHCFVEYLGWYYDAEEPYGVPDPSLLPLFARQLHREVA